MTQSKLASRNGSAWPSAPTGQNNGLLKRACAASSIAGAMSAPTTEPNAPTTGSAIKAASPVPVETSSTRHPDVTSAARNSEGNKQSRPPACETLIGRGIGGTARSDVEARAKLPAHHHPPCFRHSGSRSPDLNRICCGFIRLTSAPLPATWAEFRRGRDRLDLPVD